MQMDISILDADDKFRRPSMSLPTTLYDVIAAVQDSLKPYDHDALVTATVVHMLNTHRVVMNPDCYEHESYSVRPTFAT